MSTDEEMLEALSHTAGSPLKVYILGTFSTLNIGDLHFKNIYVLIIIQREKLKTLFYLE